MSPLWVESRRKLHLILRHLQRLLLSVADVHSTTSVSLDLAQTRQFKTDPDVCFQGFCGLMSL